MNKKTVILFISLLSFLIVSCGERQSSDIQKCTDLMRKEIEKSKTSYIFIGAQWCSACKTSLQEQFLQNPRLKEDSIGVIIVYFSDKTYANSLLKETQYNRCFFRFDSYSGLDKLLANDLLKKVIPDYKKVNYMPIMLEIDSLNNYSHWLLKTPLF